MDRGTKRKRGGESSSALSSKSGGWKGNASAKGKGKAKVNGEHSLGKGKGKGKGKDNEKDKESSLSGKLHHSISLLTRAAKKARTFEVQKLLRKIKTNEKGKNPLSPAAIVELESIADALKEIDTDTLAVHALLAKLDKDKSPAVRDSGDVQAFLASQREKMKVNIKDEGVVDPTSSMGKAQNKVLASKTFQEVMKEVITSIKARLESSADAVSSLGKERKDKGKERALLPTPSIVSESTGETANDAIAKLLAARRSHIANGSSMSTDSDSDASTSDSEDDGLAGDDDDDDDDDRTVSHISADEDMLGDEGEEEFGGISPGSDSDGEDDDDEDDDGAESMASDTSFPTAHTASSKTTKLKSTKADKSSKSKKTKGGEQSIVPISTSTSGPAITSSAFLPSLAAGYTLGDSDGSVYSDEGDEIVGPSKPEKKNRRGQRARQAIWEKKYGKNAAHVKKRSELEAGTEASRARAKAEREIEALKRSGRYAPPGVDVNLTTSVGGVTRQWASAVNGTNGEGGGAGGEVDIVALIPTYYM